MTKQEWKGPGSYVTGKGLIQRPAPGKFLYKDRWVDLDAAQLEAFHDEPVSEQTYEEEQRESVFKALMKLGRNKINLGRIMRRSRKENVK